ncbi:MAG TPA: universal stress protein [Methylovirgula sp.]|nr:universal stress protein [Methylovirgula sp.]
MSDPPDAQNFAPSSILLASEGRRISQEAIALAVRLARKSNAPVHVFVIARIWGSSFGLPHPGLMPTKREWQAHREIVADAVAELKREGIEATGSVVSSRNAAGRILTEARRLRSGAIIMGAPPPRHWLVAGFMWEHEPYRVRRKAQAPVYLVVDRTPLARQAPTRREEMNGMA